MGAGWEGWGVGVGGICHKKKFSLRAIWKVILFVWKQRSSMEFYSAGKEKRGMFFRESKFTVGM